MRPLSEWNESDLQRLIADDVQESLTLDYKRSDALSKSDDKKKLEISKDVSAFANSAGGRIVYGIREKDQHPEAVDDGADPKLITREWLEQVINTTIQPRIHGVVIKPIPLANGSNAFVVDIPKAEAGGPHQAGDQRYYRRFNFQSVPMAHHEIMDVANRAASPLIDVAWTKIRTSVASDWIDLIIGVSLQNRSKQPALYGAVTLFVDEDGEPDRNNLIGTWTADRDVPIETPAGKHKFRMIGRTFAVPADQPIYREMDVSLGRLGMQVKLHVQYVVGWRFSCPGYSALRWGVFDVTPDQRVRWHWFSEAEE